MRVFITKTLLPARGYTLMAAKRLTEEDIENIFNDSSSDDDAISNCSETYSEVLEVESSEESGEETDENNRSSIDTIAAKNGTRYQEEFAKNFAHRACKSPKCFQDNARNDILCKKTGFRVPVYRLETIHK